MRRVAVMSCGINGVGSRFDFGEGGVTGKKQCERTPRQWCMAHEQLDSRSHGEGREVHGHTRMVSLRDISRAGNLEASRQL